MQFEFASTAFRCRGIAAQRTLELTHVDYDYFVCDVRWHSLQRQQILGGLCAYKASHALFPCNLLHHGYAALWPPAGVSVKAIVLVRSPTFAIDRYYLICLSQQETISCRNVFGLQPT